MVTKVPWFVRFWKKVYFFSLSRGMDPPDAREWARAASAIERGGP